ncbi:MAG: ATP-binding protein [Desulfobacteraceae bacterium]|nr:ATP-binding protein [Desulfobacteraceae bacterium]
MIKEIDINKFRCFKKSKFSGFKAVNLIGGQNNCGKTALLESLYLNLSPRKSTIMVLRRFRRESSEFAKNMPERTWNNFFFNLDNDKTLSIISRGSDGNIYNNIELLCDESTDQFDEIFEEEEQSDDDLVDLRTLFSERNFTRSTLNINLLKDDGKKHLLTSLIAHSKGIISKDSDLPDEKKKVNYIPALSRLSSDALSREYDKADIKGNSQKILNAIQLIGKSITEIKTFNIGEPTIYLKKSEGEYLPIYLYGEAISKTTDFILRIVNDPDSVLLIDEIENGIHHTNQYDLWRNIFELSSLFNVQIFATTHSYEMIQSFVQAGLSKDVFKESACYLEMTKSIKSGEIVGIERDLENLNYEINQKMGFRGE